MGEHAAWIIPIVSVVASAGSAAYQTSQKKSAASKGRRRSRALWQATAFPSAAEKEAATGKLGQARQASYQSMASELASRGMGPGSGVGAQRARGIETGYGKAYAHLMSEMGKPRWPMPGMPHYGGPGVGGAAVGAGTEALNEAMGYYWASQMYGGGGGGFGGAPYGGSYAWTGLEGMPYMGTS